MGSKWLIAAGLIAGIVVGAGAAVAVPAVLSAAIPVTDDQTHPPTAPGVVPGSSGVNDHGQSYGQSTDPTFEDAPDLIEAFATNGEIGYVYAAELRRLSAPAATIAEAQAATNSPTTLGVFLTDGTTRIGDFIVGVPSEEN